VTRALITGGAGFIGSHLAERLLEDGTEVRAIDRLSDYYDPELKRANLAALDGRPGFEAIEGDLSAVDAAELLDGVDVVYHLAGQPGVRASWGDEFDVYVRDNVIATQRLLEAGKDAELERFVYASSSSVYGNAERYPTSEADLPRPVSPYGVTKLAAEHLCHLYHEAFGVPTVAVRYFTIYGPRQRPDMAFNRFIAGALEGRPLRVFGDGQQIRDFTYVSDAVTATVAAATKGVPGRSYNIAGGNQATVADVIEILGELAGGEVAVEHTEAVRGDARRTGADTTLARRDLGYAPEVSLEAGIARQFAHQRERAASGAG
jgi:UDP-glucuronate 4-epimerase